MFVFDFVHVLWPPGRGKSPVAVALHTILYVRSNAEALEMVGLQLLHTAGAIRELT